MGWIKQSHIYMNETCESKYLSNQLAASECEDGGLVHLVPGPRCWSCDVGIIPQIQSRVKVTKVTAEMGEGDDLELGTNDAGQCC